MAHARINIKTTHRNLGELSIKELIKTTLQFKLGVFSIYTLLIKTKFSIRHMLDFPILLFEPVLHLKIGQSFAFYALLFHVPLDACMHCLQTHHLRQRQRKLK
jgi:hypothetical protein